MIHSLGALTNCFYHKLCLRISFEKRRLLGLERGVIVRGRNSSISNRVLEERSGITREYTYKEHELQWSGSNVTRTASRSDGAWDKLGRTSADVNPQEPQTLINLALHTRTTNWSWIDWKVTLKSLELYQTIFASRNTTMLGTKKWEGYVTRPRYLWPVISHRMTW